MGTWKDVLAVLGLLLIGWVILALCEATGMIHTLILGGHYSWQLNKA